MNKTDKKNIYFNISLICIVLTSTLKYFVNPIVTKILPVIAVFFALIGINNKFKLKKYFVGFLFFYLVFIFGSLKSGLLFQTLGDILSFGLCIILVICFNNEYIDCKIILKILKYFCLLFSIMTIIEYFNFDFMYSIHSRIYDSNTLYNIQAWKNNNSFYTGIFPDRAPAAFFSCILIGLSLIKIINDRSIFKNKIIILEFLIGLFSLLLIAKRGLFLGTLISIFIVYFVNNKAKNKSIIGTIISEVILMLIFTLFLISNSSAETILNSFFYNDNVLTGRLDIYSFMIPLFKNHPILGIGTGYINHALGIGGHNIYLNILTENGLVGFIPFIVSVIMILICSIKSVKEYIYDNNLTFKNLYGLFIQILFIIYGFSGNPLYDNYILYMYFLGIILCFMNPKKKL